MNTNNYGNKSHYEQEQMKSKEIAGIKQAKISNQIIMTSRVPRYPVLNPPEKQLCK